MSNMKIALKNAGLVDQADRLEETAVEALVGSKNNWLEAKRLFQAEIQRPGSLQGPRLLVMAWKRADC